jgi:hypothetical protein
MADISNIEALLAEASRQKRSYDEAQRPRDVREREAKMGLSDIYGYTNPSPLTPPSTLDKTSAALNLAATSAANEALNWAQTGMEVAGLPGVAEELAKRKAVYENRADIYDDYLRSGGAGATELAASLIAKNWPEFVNPFKNPIANAAFHGARGFVNSGVPQAGVSAGSNILGETLESAAASKIPFLNQLGGLPGNVIGAAIENSAEKIANKLREYYDRMIKK